MGNRIYVLINTKPGKTEDVQAAVKKLNYVTVVDIITGRYDIIAILEGDELNQLLNTIARELHRISGIEKTETLVSVETNQ